MTLRPVFIDHTSERGGAELALRRMLSAPGEWHPALICPPARETDVYAGLPATVTVERRGPAHRSRADSGSAAIGAVRLAWGVLRSLVTVVRSPSARGSSVLIANTSRASVYTAVAGRILRKPVVVHIRDLVEPQAIGGLATTLLRRIVLPQAAGVVANSRASLATVEPFIAEHCLTEVIPSPSGLRRRNAPEMRDRVTRVGIVARIDPWKGQDLLLRAFAEALPTSDTQLIFFGAAAFGTDGYFAHLRAMAKEMNVEDRVIFAGHVEDVTDAIDQLDICIQCSVRPEPLGQNVLQYLAAGKPTIVADEGGPIEWVRDNENGLVFRARDAASLASCLKRLAEDRDLRERLAIAALSTPGLSTDAEVTNRMGLFLARVVEAA